MLITTRFTAASTADEVLHGVDLDGLRVVVTGATSGLGRETARALTAAGAQVTLAVRDEQAGHAVAAAIAAQTGQPRPPSRHLDLTDRKSIDRFTENWTGPLHVLVNNAGLVTGGRERTAEGWEKHFATNHLGHFALARGLHRALAQGAAERGQARVVSLTSTAHMRSNLDFDDLQMEHVEYHPQIAYARSKTANSLFAVEATHRWAADGIYANAVNPGGIRTGLQRHFTAQQKDSLDAAEAAGTFVYKSIAQGAATSIVAAVAPELDRTGGHYLDDGQEAYTVGNDADLAEHPHGVKEWALNAAAAERLWEVSRSLLG